MAKVGLKDTLTLLAKGYSKKEIDALAELDEQTADQAPASEDKKEQDQKSEVVTESTPVSDPEPDYKTMYEDLLKEKEAKEKEIKDKDEQIKEIQKDNIHEDNLPEIEKTYEEEQASLIDAIRSFY